MDNKNFEQMLEEGVFKPSHKLGDSIFYIADYYTSRTISKFELKVYEVKNAVDSIMITEDGFEYYDNASYDPFAVNDEFDDKGTFWTKEEAEEYLKTLKPMVNAFHEGNMVYYESFSSSRVKEAQVTAITYRNGNVFYETDEGFNFTFDEIGEKYFKTKEELQSKESDKNYEYKNGHVFTYDSHNADTELDDRSGTLAEIISPLEESEYDREEVGDMYKVRFLSDGHETAVFADEIADIDRSKYENLDVYLVDAEMDILRNYYYNEQNGNIEEEVIYNLPEFLAEYKKDKASDKNASFIEKFQEEAKNYYYEDESDFGWFAKEVEMGNRRADNRITLEPGDNEAKLVEFCQKTLDLTIKKENPLKDVDLIID